MPSYTEEISLGLINEKLREADEHDKVHRVNCPTPGHPFRMVDVKKVSFGYLFSKRIFDIISSGLGLLILSPLFLILSLLVKTTSKGPVFFKDKRIGKDNKIIYVLKFRSMYADAEARLKDYLTPEQYLIWKQQRKLDNDPRITKIGKFLRKTSLDELPQLISIFKGDMSVVGPRPVTSMELVENFNNEQRYVLLSARPGLLGNWAVNGRSNVEFDNGERQYLEIEYFAHRSLGFDIKLMFKAVITVFKHEGAH